MGTLFVRPSFCSRNCLRLGENHIHVAQPFTERMYPMTDTIYASFADAALAEKAAGALLDRGAKNEDISIVSRDDTRDTREEREEPGEYATGVSHTTAIDHSTGDGEDRK